jgi:ketosteroid isomerase-like protein
MSQEKADRGVRIAPPEIRGRAGQRRALDERLVVRFPAVAHALAPLLFRLSPQSRIRRLFMARAMARAYAAANRRDFPLILALNDGDAYEYRPSRDLLPPDMATIYRGHEGYREFWRLWLEAFEDIRWDPEEILDLGDRALVTTRQSGHGSGSGVAVSEPVYQLFTFKHGLVIRQEDFLDRAEALEAAGLSE